MSTPRFEVGQHVWIRSVNRNMSGEGTVAKVGRSLVYVQGQWGTPVAYRIDTGIANDKYGHEPDDEMAEVDRRTAVEGRWKTHGLRREYGHGQLPVDVMEAIADLLDGAA
jgi:hypothetical protein